jgi:hypothetical protein
LANVKQIFSSETAWQNGAKLCFLPSLAPFGQAVSEEKIFLTVANQKKELLLVAIFVGQMEPNEDASCQVWLHLAATVKKIFSSETAWPNGAKLGRKHICKVLY